MRTTLPEMEIYCAGPLFNEPERSDMLGISRALESSGYRTFLPQRDGLELAMLNRRLVEAGYTLAQANSLLQKAIFELDTTQVHRCDGLVLNMNGRVPDEGAMVEAGIAWALGKPIVTYKTDSRSVIDGVDNPLVLGLSNFQVVSEMTGIPVRFDELFNRNAMADPGRIQSSDLRMGGRGEKLWSILNDRGANRIEIDDFIVALND